MVQALHHRPRMTEAEYLALPESMTRMDFIDGEMIVSPTPVPRHQLLAQSLHFALETWRRSRPMPRPIVMMAPSDVRFAPNRILQPDLYILAAGSVLPKKGPVLTVPFLCIEVLSTKRALDRVKKRAIYAEAGVSELWTVDPRKNVVETWTGTGLADRVVVEAGVLTSDLLPGFELELEELFE